MWHVDFKLHGMNCNTAQKLWGLSGLLLWSALERLGLIAPKN